VPDQPVEAALFRCGDRLWGMIVLNGVRRALPLAALVLVSAACGNAVSAGSAARPATADSTSVAATPETIVAATPATVTPPPTPAGAQPGALDPVQAAQMLILPLHYPEDPTQTVCRPAAGTSYSQAAGCPVTKRLEARLQSHPTPNVEPVCRCQNTAPTDITTVSNDGETANLQVTFRFPDKPYSEIFIVVNAGGRWFVDDTTCGTANSSIYLTPVKACWL
jgi:hypothetical protein